MARLFISYKSDEQDYAFAVRQWLMDQQGWASEDIFIDAGHLHAGDEWEKKLLTEAELCEAMLFIASDLSLSITSFCYRELQHAMGQILAVTIKGVQPSDPRLDHAIPDRAKSRQITALDQEPTQPFAFVSPKDNTNGSAQLNGAQVSSIGDTLRELGIAPNSFSWTPTDNGPFPGLKPLMEGDEAIFCGRDIEIRDGVRAVEDLRAMVTQKALVIQAPSGAGKSSFLRAGLWRRLRRHAGFTPLAIVRPDNGIIRNAEWGLAAGLWDTLKRHDGLSRALPLSRDEIVSGLRENPSQLLERFADADAGDSGRRTLLIGIDQAEEMAALAPEDEAELDAFLAMVVSLPDELDLRLVLTARDDSMDATLDRLARAGIEQAQVTDLRLHRLAETRFGDVISGPAEAAARAGWPLQLSPDLTDALAGAATAGGEGGDALPILALSLQRLVAKKRAPDGRLALQPEEARVFVESAVADATADALAAAHAGTDDLRRLVIPRLATWDPQAGGDGAAKRKVADAQDLFSGDRASLQFLADALVEQRLLTRSQTETRAVYEVAHEALLRVAPLGQLIYARREKFEQARILEIEAQDWVASGRSQDRLGRSGERLREAMALLKDPDFGPELADGSAEVAGYLEVCDRHEREQIDKQRRIIGRAFVKPALQSAEDERHEHALRLVAAGALLAEDAELDLVPELKSPLGRAIAHNQTRSVLAGHEDWVRSAAFSPDGSRIVTASRDETARVWDAASGAEITLLLGHENPVESAGFSPDGSRIVTASRDETARVWDAASGVEIAGLKGHENWVRSAAFSPDGARIVTASRDETARVWDAASGVEIAGLKGHENWVRSAAFSPDGARIVTASTDTTTRVWDAASGAEIACLKGHEDSVMSVAFSPDGARIVTASDDKTARVWDVSRTEAFPRGWAIVLASALDKQIGLRTPGESRDLLMQDAPEDMFAAAMAHLTPEQASRVPEASAILRAPLHPNCYLSPTQFAEKFGGASSPEPAAEDEAEPPDSTASPKDPITAPSQDPVDPEPSHQETEDAAQTDTALVSHKKRKRWWPF